MKIFIDSADVKEIREAAALGVVDGVTTNPSLILKSGRPFKEVALEILAIVDGPISLEVTALDCEGMLKEGRALAQLHKNVVVKVPLIPEGLKAVKIFTREAIKTNVTLCFSAGQALLAAKAGAGYISPFVGRLDDIGQTGMELIRDIKTIYGHYGFATEILVASVRNPIHFKDAALMGADVATLPYAVIQQLLHHPLTESGLKKFLADWEQAKK